MPVDVAIGLNTKASPEPMDQQYPVTQSFRLGYSCEKLRPAEAYWVLYPVYSPNYPNETQYELPQ